MRASCFRRDPDDRLRRWAQLIAATHLARSLLPVGYRRQPCNGRWTELAKYISFGATSDRLAKLKNHEDLPTAEGIVSVQQATNVCRSLPAQSAKGVPRLLLNSTE